MWAAVAVHGRTSDETLRVLARHGSPLIQDIIMTNQVRLLAHLEILDELRANPRVTQVVLRRVHEFEEEFIEKAISGSWPSSTRRHQHRGGARGPAAIGATSRTSSRCRTRPPRIPASARSGAAGAHYLRQAGQDDGQRQDRHRLLGAGTSARS